MADRMAKWHLCAGWQAGFGVAFDIAHAEIASAAAAAQQRLSDALDALGAPGRRGGTRSRG